MDSILQDVRLALRRLRKAPLFAFVAILSIGLGIGANTAVFSLLDRVLIRSLPVRDPSQLVLLQAPGPRSGWMNSDYDDTVVFSYPMYRDLRDKNTVFDGVLARAPISLAASWHGQTDRVPGEIVSGNYFQVLGAQAAIGRTLLPEDDLHPDAHPVAVLDYRYWKTHFGGDPTVLNQTFTLNSHPMTIVGIMEPGFHGVGTIEHPAVYMPMMMRAEMYSGRQDLENRRSFWLNIFARLKPGVSAAKAEVAMNTIWRPILEMEAQALTQASAKGREKFINQRLQVTPEAQGINAAPDEFASAMTVLMAMVGLLLLIACANVANLMIARGTSRQKEIAIYLALGAKRGRLFRQVMVESLVISLGGAALGLLLAAWTGDVIVSMLPMNTGTSNFGIGPDWRVLTFTLALSVFTGLLFGLAPALQAIRQDVSTMLKDQAASVMGGRQHMRLRKTLVVAQVALSLVLLIAAGLFSHSLQNLHAIPTGFRMDHLLAFEVQPKLNGYSDEKRRAFYTQLEANLAGLPGVQGVAAANVTLLAGDNSMSGVKIPGHPFAEGESHSFNENYVSAGFFGVMGIPLRRGRDFTAEDNVAGTRVAIVNETMARKLFDGDALGKQFAVEGKTVQIVGVVSDSKTVELREKPVPFMYFPYRQDLPGGMTFYVRTNESVSAVVIGIRQQVGSLDADLPVFNVKTVERQVDESLFVERLVATLSVVFGGLATVLAAVGLYGVMAYLVMRRTREIGIRMALGATPGVVLRMVMSEVTVLAGIGVLLALGAWFPLGRLIKSQLFAIPGQDLLVVSAATVLLAGVTLFAGFVPARRATRIEPVSALRYE